MTFPGQNHLRFEKQMSEINLQMSMSAKGDAMCDLKASFIINRLNICYDYSFFVI